ncbi:MAG: MarR family transcriptional regulator [Holdemanella biformis]|nr:MarR family transcriptional regulator [Holdemanella biformis]MEE0474459.1 MarR family transcriptional regulator [Holdemanella biformis]
MFTIEEFLRISNQMRDYYAKKIKDSFQEFNFLPNEISILIILKNNSTITTSTELKVVLGVSKTLISRSVDSLEKKGLIRICIDEKDTRVHHLKLTQECQPILKIIDEEIGKINKTLFYDVSVEEMKSLKQTMNKLQKRVEEGKQLYGI